MRRTPFPARTIFLRACRGHVFTIRPNAASSARSAAAWITGPNSAASAERPAHTGKEPYNFFLSVIFPDNQMKILDYNRVVTDLNGLSKDELISEIEAWLNEEPTTYTARTSGKTYKVDPDKGDGIAIAPAVPFRHPAGA